MLTGGGRSRYRGILPDASMYPYLHHYMYNIASALIAFQIETAMTAVEAPARGVRTGYDISTISIILSCPSLLMWKFYHGTISVIMQRNVKFLLMLTIILKQQNP